MNYFEKTKQKIMNAFGLRPGFTDEVFDVITASYLYLQNNFNINIKNEDIVDVENFKINDKTLQTRTIANIYLNRIYNNVLKITSKTKATGQYFSKQKMIAIAKTPHVLSTYEYLNLNDNQKQKLIKQLNAKVIAHELFHASSDNGIGIGYLLKPESLGIVHKNIINIYYKNSIQKSAENSKLEEMITEILALNAVGANIITKHQSILAPFYSNKKTTYSFVCRNINSSNAPLNPLAEYFVKTFKNCIPAKFTNGFKFLADMSYNYENFGYLTQNHFNTKMYNHFKIISTYAKQSQIENTKKAYKLMAKYQANMIRFYLNNLKIESVDSLYNTIDDLVTFKTFAVRENDKIFNSINNQLQSLINICKINCEKFNLNYGKIIEEKTNKIFNIQKNIKLNNEIKLI